MILHKHIIVSGRVQGVLFRAFTKSTAEKLGLKGYVENRGDGTVLVEVEGNEDKLTMLEGKLREGSKFSKVQNVEVKVADNIVGYADFKIKYKNFLDRF